jgi:hypothetical protein
MTRQSHTTDVGRVAASGETGSRASHRANSSVVSTKGFDPARELEHLKALVLRIEEADRGTKALDAAICESVFPLNNGQFLFLHVTTSIDDAVKTLPSGSDWRLLSPKSASAYAASPYNAAAQKRHDGFGATIPLRICAAALKVRIEALAKIVATNARKVSA